MRHAAPGPRAISSNSPPRETADVKVREYRKTKPRALDAQRLRAIHLSESLAGTHADGRVASAQIPDSGLQRKQTIDEIRRTNALLTEIRNLLKNDTLNVRVAGADKKASASAAPRAPRRAKP